MIRRNDSGTIVEWWPGDQLSSLYEAQEQKHERQGACAEARAGGGSMSNREKFRITWEAADGYCGGSRPHTFSIPADYFVGDESESDLRELFNDELQREFEEKVTPSTKDEDAFVEWAKEQIAKMRESA